MIQIDQNSGCGRKKLTSPNQTHQRRTRAAPVPPQSPSQGRRRIEWHCGGFHWRPPSRLRAVDLQTEVRQTVGFRWDLWTAFPKAKPGWPSTGILSTNLGTETPPKCPAGCAESTQTVSRSSRSTALIWAARFVGFKNRDCSCAPATEARSMRMDRMPPVHRPAGFSSTRTKSTAAN